ncbi:MAG: hypothetical protein K2G35_00430 [Duncaniella sp.]|nr:hypothetical protein [Duncaniella sp.]
MNKIIHCLTGALMVWGLSGCSDEPGTHNDTSKQEVEVPELSAAESRIIESQTNFAFRLFEKFYAKQENMALSPLSISLNLSMIANATEGEAREEIVATLGNGATSVEELNALNRLIMKSFPYADRKTDMEISNSLWVPKSVAVNDAYNALLTENYESETKELASNAIEAMNTINSFVSEKTHGIIPEFLSNPVYSTLVLNTCYFKAPWATTNVKEDRLKFSMVDGKEAKVPAFVLSGIGCKDDELTIGRSNYGNGAYQMTVVVGPDKHTLPSISEIAAKWNDWSDDRAWSKVGLTVPEWDTTFKDFIGDQIKELGIKLIFDSETKFEAMTSSPGVRFTDVLHGVRVISDKKGTEAAAATAVTDFTSAGPSELTHIDVDRPFVYIISEKTTKAILFIGMVGTL